MNRTRALTWPSLAAWGAALTLSAAAILCALALGRPKFLLAGLGAVVLGAGLLWAALRYGTGGWLAAGVLFAAGLIPHRVFTLWESHSWGGAFNLVIAATVALAGLAWLGRVLVQRAGRSNGVALVQVLLFVIALAGVLVRGGEYFSMDRPARALVWMFAPMLGFWVTASSRLSRREALVLIRLLLAVGAVMALLGLRWPLQLWQAKSAGFLFGASSVSGFRTMTPVGGPGLSAMMLAIVAPVAVAMAIHDRRGWRALWIVCALTFMIAVVFSISRTGIIAAVGAMLLFAWLNRRLLRRRLPVVAILVAVLVGLIALVVVNYRDYTNFARVTRFLDADDPSDRLRITSARAAFEVGGGHPLLGSGIARHYPRDVGSAILVEGIPSARDPHSLYLLALAEFGVPGLLLVLWLLARPILDFWRERGRAGPVAALLLSAFACSAAAIALYSIASCAMFVHFRVATVAWWTVGLGYQFVQVRPDTSSA